MASIIKVKNRWRAQVRRKGFPSYTRTFATKAAAVEWAQRIEAAMLDGRAPSIVAGECYLLRDVVADYRKLRGQSRPVRDDSNEHYTLRALVRLLGDLDATALSVDDLLGFARTRSDEGAGPYTVNMDVGKLGTVLRLVSGAKRLNLPDVVAQARPVLSHLGLIGGGGRRERRPTEDELQGILAWLAAERGRVYADFVRFAVLTAMRRSEICRALWQDVDSGRRMLLVRARKHPRQKQSNDEWIPLLGEAWDVLQAQPRGDERIFPVHPQTMTKYFGDACKALAIPDLHLHDMRHEGVSRLFERGYSIPEVAMVSGHKKWETLQRYANLRPEDLHKGPR